MSIPIPPHLGGAYDVGDANTLCFDVFGYLICKYDLKSVVDIGCGYGHALEFFSKCGVPGRGFDGDPNAVAGGSHRASITLHDFTQGPPPVADDAVFDLGWSAEFLEHVEGRFMPNYMALFQKCKIIVATHGEPGQPGHHHVTLLPTDEWVKHFNHYGFTFDQEETRILRRTDRWKSGWGRRTLMLYHNRKFQL